jgi:hypothetical protein
MESTSDPCGVIGDRRAEVRKIGVTRIVVIGDDNLE